MGQATNRVGSIIEIVKNIESRLQTGDICQSVGQKSLEGMMNIGEFIDPVNSLSGGQVKHLGDNLTQDAEHHNTQTTLSKTPSMGGQQLATIQAAAEQFMISPHIFKKQKESRFKFAHSVDPLNAKNLH